MELLVNDTVLFTGSKEECILQLHDMVKRNKECTIVSDSLTETFLKHPRFGDIHWHIEYIKFGGTFKGESE